MIVEHESTAVNKTEITSDTFGIEVSPLLYKLMYTHLYEDKEKIVIQELAANALDAHKAAGIEDTPIHIQLPSVVNPELVISDFGTGMSEEFVRTLYTTYGASSKRADNEAIGGFGYGSKSPFAISDAFTVKTTQDGTTTTIACFLDNGLPSFSIFTNESTGAPSGTTITIPVSDTVIQDRLKEKAKFLFLLWETKPSIVGLETQDNTDKDLIEKHDHFWYVCESVFKQSYDFRLLSSSVRVAVGPFIYNIPVNALNVIKEEENYKNLEGLYSTVSGTKQNASVVLGFAVGELELSPSREHIEDTPKNIETIKDKLAQVNKILSRGSVQVTTDTLGQLADLIKTKGHKCKKGIMRFIDTQHVVDFVKGHIGEDATKLAYDVYVLNMWKPDRISKVLNEAAAASPEETEDLMYRLGEVEFCGEFSRSITVRMPSSETRYISVPDINALLNADEASFRSAMVREIRSSTTLVEMSYITYNSVSNRVLRSTSSWTVSRSTQSGIYLLSKGCQNATVNSAARTIDTFVEGTPVAAMDATGSDYDTVLQILKTYSHCVSEVLEHDWIVENAKKYNASRRKQPRTQSSGKTSSSVKNADSEIEMAYAYDLTSRNPLSTIYKDKIGAVGFPEGTKVLAHIGSFDSIASQFSPYGSAANLLRSFGSAAPNIVLVSITSFKARTKAGKTLIDHLEKVYDAEVCANITRSVEKILLEDKEATEHKKWLEQVATASRKYLGSSSRRFLHVLGWLIDEFSPVEDQTHACEISNNVAGCRTHLSTDTLLGEVSTELFTAITVAKRLADDTPNMSQDSKEFKIIKHLFTDEVLKEFRRLLVRDKLLTEKKNDSLHTNQ